MIQAKTAINTIGKLSMLPFFPGPTEERARHAIVSLVCGMADNNEQIDWLVNRCLQLWRKWEGPAELRAVFCSRFRPVDGVEAYSKLKDFAEGIPSETGLLPGEYRQLPVSEMRQISGVSAPVDFPRDATDLLGEVRQRRKAVAAASVPDDAEIERIKAIQEANRAAKG